MQNKIILEIGPKGSGKTYTACEGIKKMERVVVFDMVSERAYAAAIGAPEEIDPDLPPDNKIIVGRPKELAQAMPQGKEHFKIVYRPIEIEIQDNGLVNAPEFGPVTKLCFLRGDLWFVIDEAHLLCNSRNCPKDLMVANLLGRHRRMSMVLVAQSFTGIHPAIRKNADEFMFWRLIEPSDLEAIRQRCGREVEEQVRNLRVLERDPKTEKLIKPGQMLHWDKLKGVVSVSE